MMTSSTVFASCMVYDCFEPQDHGMPLLPKNSCNGTTCYTVDNLGK